MQKNNLIIGLASLVLGIAVSYFTTQYINQNPAKPAAENAPQQPAGGPPPQIMEMITKARDEPDNFEAQMQAAALYKQINGIQPRPDFVEKEIEFLNRALKLKPNDETAMVTLTNVLLEKGDKTEAQKTFQQLEKIPSTNAEIKAEREILRKKIKTS